MRKYPSDVSESENRIDANLEMVKRLDSDSTQQFSLFLTAGMVHMDNTQNCL